MYEYSIDGIYIIAIDNVKHIEAKRVEINMRSELLPCIRAAYYFGIFFSAFPVGIKKN